MHSSGMSTPEVIYTVLHAGGKFETSGYKVIKENDIIAVESLKINEMIQKKHLSKKIYDVSWYELIRQLEYKAKWKGKYLYKIDTYFVSSQICSHCGYQDKRIKDLSIRKWEYLKCTSINLRDLMYMKEL